MTGGLDIDIHSLSPEEFRQHTLVDIREPNECTAWPALSDKVVYLPLSEIQERIDEFNAKTSYLLFCAKGGRSHYLAEVLQSRGINAVSIDNGIASVNSYLKKHFNADRA